METADNAHSLSGSAEKKEDFLSSPKVLENYSLLNDIGAVNYIKSLESEIRDHKKLLSGAMDIFHQTTISDIMDSTVWQISERLFPSYVVFIWKPLQSREDITMKCYRNYKLVEMNLKIDNITDFDLFFRKHQEPVEYKFFASKMGDNKKIKALDAIEPWMVLPILGPSGLYGIILLGTKSALSVDSAGTDNSRSESEFIKDLMSFVSKAIQNHLHYERTLRDVKTGLYNHSFFLNRLNEEIIRSRRISSWTSVIIMDVDNFKSFNDNFGHLAGDRILETLAITIKQGVRVGDVPSRFGGEEFTVLLPDTDKEEAWTVAERLRTMVANMKVIWEPPVSQITISLGVITFNKEMNVPAEEVIRRADAALYMSKEMGRDCTNSWNTGLLKRIEKMRLQA